MPTSIAAERSRIGLRRTTTVWVALAAVLVVLALVAAMLVSRRPVPSAAGVGDPNNPSAGGSGYDVTSYDLDLAFDPASGRLQGSATVTLTPRENLAVLHLDLALAVTSARLGGVDLPYDQSDGDLAIRPAPAWPVSAGFVAGRPVSLVVTYEGRPADARLSGEGAVYTQGDETLIAGEPEAAAAWYPANDHPSDPARFALTVRVPAGYQAISVGRLVAHTSEAAGETWRWATDEPTVTYATMLAVGRFDVVVENARVADRDVQAVYAVSRQLPGGTERTLQWLRTSPAQATILTRWLGPYPSSSIGGVVTAARPWWGGLETLGRPVYHPYVVGEGAVVAHELAHMWLGDTVTLHRWDDLFLNESLTSYVEWLAEEQAGRVGPQARFDDLYAKAPASFWRQRLSDPGPGRALFTRVYDRGAMAVHATRVAMGDEAFFPFLRAWAQQSGPASLEQWRAQAQRVSPVDLQPLFAAWLDGTTKVPQRPELGFG